VNTLPTVLVVGTAQTLAWASSYYLPAVLAAPIAADLGTDASQVHFCFSVALLVAALFGPRAGRLIDRHGGRTVLPFTNALFALGLVLLAAAQGGISLLGAWLVIGVAMGFGLYDAAFAALVCLYGAGARQAITGITLIAGFASTVGWPLSMAMQTAFGWRGALLGWALLHLSLGVLLNRRIPHPPLRDAPCDPAAPLIQPPTPPPRTAKAAHAANSAKTSEPAKTADSVDTADSAKTGTAYNPSHGTALLVFAFAATGFAGTAMAAHLPTVLQASGASLALAVAAGALIGPAQVGARLLQFGPFGRVHPLWSAWLADLAHPLAVLALMLVGPGAAMVFALVHGLGTGTQTIARGTLPLALFGAAGYGERVGRLLALSRFTQALAPWLFGLALARWGEHALWITFALSLLALAALLPFRSALRSGKSETQVRKADPRSGL